MNSGKSAIKIFCRVKPTPGTETPYEIATANHDTGEELLKFSVKPSYTEELSIIPFKKGKVLKSTPTKSGKQSKHRSEAPSFRFTEVFDKTASQEHVFNQVAAPVIDSAFEGYNGTIFAYGQTGSGKTYTMTGNQDVLDYRGIIPRSLEYILDRVKTESDPMIIRNVSISYMEIYNESGYDLLNAKTTPGRLEDFSKVTLMEGANKEIKLRNLSVHSIESVEDAMHLLYLGDHNRVIAETPLNDASTRSHCIFTIYVKTRDDNSGLTRRSKLNLVDLAGSERLTSSSGQLLTETRHINLALHYLEQVIVKLSDPTRTHVPYRNSMMTSVLRDSLGGNCLTTMIATISLESKNYPETLATCRFGQRVSLVTNTVVKNEVKNTTEVITELKQEVKKLKETISFAAVKPLKEKPEPLDSEEKSDCQALVDKYLNDPDSEAVLAIIPDMRLIQECFRLLKSAKHGTPQLGQESETLMLCRSTSSINSESDPSASSISSEYETVASSINSESDTRASSTSSECETRAGSVNSKTDASTSSINLKSDASTSTSSLNDQSALEATLALQEAEIEDLKEMLKKEKEKIKNQNLQSLPTVGIRHTEKNNQALYPKKFNSAHSDSELFHSMPKFNSIPRVNRREIVSNPATPVQISEKESPSPKLLVAESKEQARSKFVASYAKARSLKSLQTALRKRQDKVRKLEQIMSSNFANLATIKRLIRENKVFAWSSLPSPKELLIEQKIGLATQEDARKRATEQVRVLQNIIEYRQAKLNLEFKKICSTKNEIKTSPLTGDAEKKLLTSSN